MLITTTDHLDGKVITEYLGVVSAAMVFVLPGSSKVVNSSWNDSVKKMADKLTEAARDVGADAVIGVRFLDHGSSLCATGTAVRLGL